MKHFYCQGAIEPNNPNLQLGSSVDGLCLNTQSYFATLLIKS